PIAPLLQSKRRAGRVAELWSFGHFPSASLPINCCKQASQPRTPAIKSSIAVLSPRLKKQQIVATSRGGLFLFDGQRFAMETSIEIPAQFNKQDQRIPFGFHRNLMLAQ